MTPERGEITVAGRRVETLRYGPATGSAPTIVMLHEGLGSVSTWRDWPERLATGTGLGVVAYSRFGYGRSSQCALPRPLSYMHDEGLHVLPVVLAALGLERYFLYGHSDGGSIALLHAGGGARRVGLLGVMLEAAHVFVEPLGLEAIERAGAAYRSGDLKQRLQRHHGSNTACAFEGWHDAWRDPRFRHWNIERYLPAITTPLLVIQGADDPYGTQAQVDAIAGGSGGPVQTVILPETGHAPHREQPAAVLQAIARFAGRLVNPLQSQDGV